LCLFKIIGQSNEPLDLIEIPEISALIQVSIFTEWQKEIFMILGRLSAFTILL